MDLLASAWPCSGHCGHPVNEPVDGRVFFVVSPSQSVTFKLLLKRKSKKHNLGTLGELPELTPQIDTLGALASLGVSPTIMGMPSSGPSAALMTCCTG